MAGDGFVQIWQYSRELRGQDRTQGPDESCAFDAPDIVPLEAMHRGFRLQKLVEWLVSEGAGMAEDENAHPSQRREATARPAVLY